jgi:hypothetical protein
MNVECKECGAMFRARGNSGLCGPCYHAEMQAAYAARRAIAVEELAHLSRQGESPFFVPRRLAVRPETLAGYARDAGRDDLAEWLTPAVNESKQRSAARYAR